MPIKILMPALSPTMEHGNLAKWLKKEGDEVKAGDVIAEIETDKAVMEVEAVDEGKIAKILVPEGANEVAVNSLIAVLLEEDEDDGALDDFIKQNTENEAQPPEKKEEQSAAQPEKDEKEPSKAKTPQPPVEEINKREDGSKRIFASPLAKRIAKMENVDLSSIKGSGPHGRIVKQDVLSAPSVGRVAHGKVERNNTEYQAVPNSNMRKIIAKRLVESKQEVPHFYLAVECCMDSLMSSRSQINQQVGDDKAKKISVNDFVILAVAKALKEVPEANASWNEDTTLRYNNVDISVAVSVDGGLITPIIKNADQKNIMTISAEMKKLAKRARENALKPEEYQGGGFSISNLGMYGIDSFNAIINPPQGCILAVGASKKKPVIIDDKIEIKTMMNVTLSCDHRVIDGVVGAQFLASFKKFMESPILMFI
ncbi:MAG: hypothetical protein DGJ47_000050 [Rickettsiaceae bacterium]